MDSENHLDNSSSTPLAAVGRDLADGRYVLVRHVAEGGTAHVYLGYDTWTETWRAIKTLLPDYASRPALRHRFEREAATMKTLSHDNIIAVYDAGIEGDTVFMVMEYAEAGSVIDWIERHGPMPPRMATNVVLELCAGIDAAHRQGVIHRDIKPQNLLVDRSGTCKVTDFGIAQVLEDTRMTMTGTVMGTMGYMAPEQNESAKHADERADVYSIAATFYTLVKGEAATHLFMAEEQDFDGIPESLASIVRTGSQYRRESRFQTVREMMGELEGALRMLAPDPLDTPPLVPYDLPSVEEMTPPSVDATATSGLGSQHGMNPLVRREPTNHEEATRDEPSVPSYIDQEWVQDLEEREGHYALERPEDEDVDDPRSLDEASDFDSDHEPLDLPDIRRTPPVVGRRQVGRNQAIRQGVAIALGTMAGLTVSGMLLLALVTANQLERMRRELVERHDLMMRIATERGSTEAVEKCSSLRAAGVPAKNCSELEEAVRMLLEPQVCLEQVRLVNRAIKLGERKGGAADDCFERTRAIGERDGRCMSLKTWGTDLDNANIDVGDIHHRIELKQETFGGQLSLLVGLWREVNPCGQPVR